MLLPLLLAATLSGTDAPPPAPPPALTEAPPPAVVLAGWDEALARLRARALEWELARADVERAGAEARAALAPLLPQLAASLSAEERLVGGTSTLGNDVGGGGEDGEDERPRPTQPLLALCATASQSVLEPGAWWRRAAARARERSAQLRAEDTWRLLVGALARSLVAGVAAERVAELDRAGLAQAEARHRLTLGAEELGSGRRLDTLRTARDVEVARAELVASVEALRRAREALGLALGAGGEVALAPGFRLDGLQAGLARGCTPLWGAERADLRATREGARAAARALSGARAAYLPSLGVQSSLTAPTVDPGVARVSTWSIAAVLQLPLYDGGLRGADVRAARAEVRVAEAERERVERTLALEVARARRAVGVAEAQRAAAERARAAAAEAEALTAEAFREGVGTSLELVQSAVDLRQAERALALRELELVEARVDALLAEATCPP